uniref:PBPb domain-containing protein n=1 Tax=Rhabditophanes sp. KR3021 TaxID=114890 RepID=A0AC35UGI3_9BILA
MIDPRVVHNNWTKAGVKKGIRYVGEAIDLTMLFDKKEDFTKEVVYDETFGKKGVIVLKMKYQAKEVAENIESILERNGQIADLILGEFFEAHNDIEKVD